MALGNSLHLKKKNETIKIEIGTTIQINDNKYILLKTNYLKQYILVKKYNSLIKDTLRFDSIISIKYYEKSFRVYTSNIIKYTKYGVLIGAIAGLPEGIKYGFHWVGLGSILYGTLGFFAGAIYTTVIPISSKEIILKKEGWSITN